MTDSWSGSENIPFTYLGIKKYIRKYLFHHSDGCQTKWLSVGVRCGCSSAKCFHKSTFVGAARAQLHSSASRSVCLCCSDGQTRWEKHAETTLLFTTRSAAHRGSTVCAITTRTSQIMKENSWEHFWNGEPESNSFRNAFCLQAWSLNLNLN